MKNDKRLTITTQTTTKTLTHTTTITTPSASTTPTAFPENPFPFPPSVMDTTFTDGSESESDDDQIVKSGEK